MSIPIDLASVLTEERRKAGDIAALYAEQCSANETLRTRTSELEEALDDIISHGVVGPTNDWMMVPKVEWDQAVERAALRRRDK